MTWEYKLAVALIHVEKFVESTPGSLMDSPESLTTEGSLKEDMSVILDGRESPDVPSSTSDSRDTIEVVNHDDSDLKSDSGGGGRHSINNSPGKNSGNNRAAGSPNEKSAPKNPLLQERCNCEELRHVICHLETKDLWDKFHDLGKNSTFILSYLSGLLVLNFKKMGKGEQSADKGSVFRSNGLSKTCP